MNQAASDVQELFSGAFVIAWKLALSQLADHGIKVGAKVRNKDDDLFTIETMQPGCYNFGDGPTAGISCYGVKMRVDGTWGKHRHWVGDVADLTVE